MNTVKQLSQGKKRSGSKNMSAQNRKSVSSSRRGSMGDYGSGMDGSGKALKRYYHVQITKLSDAFEK